MTRKNTKKTPAKTTRLDDRALATVSGGAAYSGYSYSSSASTGWSWGTGTGGR